MNEADLILFMAGNQFMVMPDLVEELKRTYPKIVNVFYETLPPGLELRQILSGGAIFQDKLLTGRPDIYTSVTESAMIVLSDKGLIEDFQPYLHNRLVLMVAEGNPKEINGVHDLMREDVRVSQPGDLEDISAYVSKMYLEAGGEDLKRRVLEEKGAAGTTVYTLVHHRETPLRLSNGTADAGPVWATEVIHARESGLKVEAIEVGSELDQRGSVNYFVAKMKEAPNPLNAAVFLEFILSEKVRSIYKKYGFLTP